MELLSSIAALSSALLIVFVVVVLLLGLWLPAVRDDDAVPLEQVLRSQGDSIAARAFLRREYAAALRRCETCTQVPQCRAWIRTGARDGYRDFCPNTTFIDRMKRVV